MKKVLCALLAVAMLVSLTACGGGSDIETDPNAETYFKIQATGDYSDGIMLPELTKEQQTVQVLMTIDWGYLETNNKEEDPFAQYHATLIWREAYQGGDVEIVTIADSELTDYVATNTAAGNAPDILPCNYDMTYPQWNAAGLTASIMDYKDYIKLDDVDPNTGEPLYNAELMNTYFQWDGTSHGAITLPEVNRYYILYNKTMFENAGVSTPLEYWQQDQWNWTNFVKVAEKLTGDMNYGFNGWALFPYLAPYPMAKYSDKGDNTVELGIDDPKYMRYMGEVYNLYQTVGAARRDRDGLQGWNDLFVNGTDAMVAATFASYQGIVERAKKYDGDTFGIAPMPVFDPNEETESIAPATLWAYSIAAAADNPVGAATYIRLETLVSRNIAAAGKGSVAWKEANLTEDEKAMLEETADDPVVVEMLRGIGSCYDIVDTSIVPPIYYEENQSDVQAVFDAQKNTLQAEFDEFNETVMELAAEKAAKEAAGE